MNFNPNDNYYAETCNNLTYYNDLNNTPLSNANIQEAIRKLIIEESITDDNNITAYKFIHASSVQR